MTGQVVRDALDYVWSRGQVERIPEFYTEDFVAHIPGPILNWMGVAGAFFEGGSTAQAVLAIREAFPDYREEPQFVIAEGDMVAARMRNTGTHTGPCRNGTPPSGRRFDIVDTMFVRLEGGRIAEQWSLFDEFHMALQLGLIAATDVPLLP